MLAVFMFAICYYIIYDLFYMASLRKTVKKHQEEWDKIKMELIEKGADYIEIADAYGKYIKVCGGCFPSL
jgi:hypothetical protein